MSLVMLNNNPFANLTLFILISIGNIIYLVKYQPFKHFRYLVRNVLTEVCFIVSYVAILKLHLFFNEIEMQTKLSYAIIISCSIILGLELLNFFVDSIFIFIIFIKT